jgi:aminopeptidase
VEEARNALVRDLVVACRLDRKDFLAAWDEHLHRLDGITALLEGKRYRALRLVGEGTNVTMELPPAHRWLTPRGRTPDGGSFLMNVPAEKIYTAPDFRRVDGTITSSRPLIFMGDDLGRVTLTWKNGKLTEFRASKDRILLEAWLTVDEGASRVGEVALVPSRSPVSRIDRPLRMNIFDESAGSHLAFGYAYPLCLEGGERLTPEQRMAAGLNVSVQHKNVVFGDPTLDVFGITPGGADEPVMTDGNWAGAFADIADAPASAPAADTPGYRKVS